jgi:hypothetical protein
MSEAIVTRALIGIGKNCVGFGSFFEFLFGFGIALVLVRVKLMCESAVGLLQILI